MRKIIFLFLLIFIFLPFNVFALEIQYPSLPSGLKIKIPPENFEDYVLYVFYFSVITSGIILLGIIIYNGVNLLLLAENPAKVTEAKNGIFSGIIGVIILLSAFLIFNLLYGSNLSISAPPPPLSSPSISSPYILAGVYFCNYKVGSVTVEEKKEGKTEKKTFKNIYDILDNYMKGGEDGKYAVKAFSKILSPYNQKEYCFRVDGSQNVFHFITDPNNYTWWIVPSPLPGKNWVYKYGFILHQEENFKKKCKILPEATKDNKIYITTDSQKRKQPVDSDSGYHTGLGFTPHSIHIFRKLPYGVEETIDSDPKAGVTLYPVGAGMNMVAPPFKETPYKPGKNEDYFFKSFFNTDENQKARSIFFNPKSKKLIAVLQGVNEKGGQYVETVCEVFNEDDVSLENNPIGRCGNCYLGACQPCTQNITVIKGEILLPPTKMAD